MSKRVIFGYPQGIIIQNFVGSLITIPGVGTAVGFVVGGVVCVFVDIFVSNWLDELIDSIAK